MPNLQSFELADMKIHRIVEQELGTRSAYSFLAGLTSDILEKNRHWMEPLALLPGTDDLAFCFQSYVVRTPHHTILIDSCIGNDKPRPLRPGWHLKHDDTFMKTLGAAGLRVEDIDFVLCTHLHADHIGWNTRLQDGRWVPTFPNARYLISKKELAYWTGKHAEKPIECIADSVLPIIEHQKADLVAASHELNDHVRLLPTPGHTIDHFSVLLGKGQDHAVMAGDLIHSPLQARYPSLCASVDLDHAQAAHTRRHFLEMLCDTPTLCCTSHFPSPSVGTVARWNKGFRFVLYATR